MRPPLKGGWLAALLTMSTVIVVTQPSAYEMSNGVVYIASPAALPRTRRCRSRIDPEQLLGRGLRCLPEAAFHSGSSNRATV